MSGDYASVVHQIVQARAALRNALADAQLVGSKHLARMIELEVATLTHLAADAMREAVKKKGERT